MSIHILKFHIEVHNDHPPNSSPCKMCDFSPGTCQEEFVSICGDGYLEIIDIEEEAV